MKKKREPRENSDIMILPDGRILAHNVSPELARLLSRLNPSNKALQRRADFRNALPN